MIIPPDSRSLNLTIWAALFCAVALWQIVTLLHPRLPSFGMFLEVLRRFYVTRWGLFFGWFWLGWHVWVRGGW